MIGSFNQNSRTRWVRYSILLIIGPATLYIISDCYVYRAFNCKYDETSLFKQGYQTNIIVYDINEHVMHAHDATYLAQIADDTLSMYYSDKLRRYPYDTHMWYLNLWLSLSSREVSPIREISRIYACRTKMGIKVESDSAEDIHCEQYYDKSRGDLDVYPIIIPKSQHGPIYVFLELQIYDGATGQPSDTIQIAIKVERKTKIRLGD